MHVVHPQPILAPTLTLTRPGENEGRLSRGGATRGRTAAADSRSARRPGDAIADAVDLPGVCQIDFNRPSRNEHPESCFSFQIKSSVKILVACMIIPFSRISNPTCVPILFLNILTHSFFVVDCQYRRRAALCRPWCTSCWVSTNTAWICGRIARPRYQRVSRVRDVVLKSQSEPNQNRNHFQLPCVFSTNTTLDTHFVFLHEKQ